MPPAGVRSRPRSAINGTRSIVPELLRAASVAILGAGRCVDHLKLFASRHIVSLVSDDIDDGPARALLGLVHQQLQFQLAVRPRRPLTNELLAIVVLVFSGIDKDRHRIPSLLASTPTRSRPGGRRR